MSKYSTKEIELKQAIVALRKKRRETLTDLTQEAYITAEFLKPTNIIGRVFSSFKNEPELKGSLFTTAVSTIGGFISKRLLLGKSSSIIKTMLGLGLQIATTKLISNKMKH